MRISSLVQSYDSGLTSIQFGFR